MKLAITLLCLFFITHFFAQEEIKVEGTFETEFYSNETKEHALKRAKEGAIINALEKGFGTAIFQGNSLYVKNIVTGEKVETKSGFNSIADTYVKGEVVEELSCEFKETPFTKKIGKKNENGIWITCDVKIRAREYKEPEANFEAYAMNCEIKENCITTDFKNKDDFFLFFQSPKTGYIAVFLDDNETSSLLFPYVTFREKYFKGFPIKAGKEYTLFSNDKKNQHDNLIVDELVWESRENMEKLIILFSPEPFELPDLKQSKLASLPANLSSEEFNKWLIGLRKKSKNLEIKKIALSTSSSKY